MSGARERGSRNLGTPGRQRSSWASTLTLCVRVVPPVRTKTLRRPLRRARSRTHALVQIGTLSESHRFHYKILFLCVGRNFIPVCWSIACVASELCHYLFIMIKYCFVDYYENLLRHSLTKKKLKEKSNLEKDQNILWKPLIIKKTHIYKRINIQLLNKTIKRN